VTASGERPTRLYAALAVLLLLTLAAVWLVSGTGQPPAGTPPENGVHATVEDARNEFLTELSRLYVLQEAAAVTPAMRSGAELAPVPFLNRELERSGAKWRVRTTSGMNAVTYDVS
jgi:hypothetical protein